MNNTNIRTMTNIGGNVASTFRTKFQVVQSDILRWFPGHMQKGVKQMQQHLKKVDCIIEVHDARVPISGRYADFKGVLTGLRPHILVLNKKDLCDTKYNKRILSHLKSDGYDNVLFTNFKDQQCKGMKQILPLAKDLIKESNRYNRSEEKSFAMMIIGVPNVGKSSLINRLRNKYLRRANATAVGAVAGITRAVLTQIKVSERPDFLVYDTPGILTPNIKDIDTGMKLALIGCLQDHLVGEELLADYLLFWLNKHKRFEYVHALGLPAPNDDIISVLTFIAAKCKRTLKVKNFNNNEIVIRPDHKYAASYFITMFRDGEFGSYCLDQDLLEQ